MDRELNLFKNEQRHKLNGSETIMPKMTIIKSKSKRESIQKLWRITHAELILSWAFP